jgi:alpha-L-rhamnosidase
VLTLILAVVASAARAGVKVNDLRCEYQRDHVYVDIPTPRLSWAMTADERGEVQLAYQIQVKRDREMIWDSGRVKSDRSVGVEYGGPPLVSGAEYQWRVRVWDRGGAVSGWSDSATWGVGFLDPADWKAKWIMPDSSVDRLNEPYLRRVFILDDAPESALARVNVMGWFELYVNGVKVGSDLLSTAVTDYSRRSLYLTYDLKPYLKKGANCIGLWISRGWYWPGRRGVEHDRPISRLQLDMRVSGKDLTVVTDASWQGHASGRTILGKWSWGDFGGEQLDARLDEPTWCLPESTTLGWKSAVEVPSPSVPAQAQRSPPDQIARTFPAVSCDDLGGGIYVVDFATNLTGWLQLHLPKLTAGKVVTIHYSDRPVSRTDLEVFNQRDQFISSGEDGELFENKFNYHGFRYASIEGLPSPPALSSVTAMAVGASWERAGSFECSNPLINRLHVVNLQTIHSLSEGGYMSDCPHRERLGYGGDGQISIDSCVMNFQMPSFYEKWTTDWRDVQDPQTGFIPHTAPQGEGGGGPAWGAGLQALTWRLNLYYDDRRALAENYSACKRYVEFLESHEKDGVLRAIGKSEWDDIGEWVPPTPIGLNNDFYFPSRDEADLFNNCYLAYLLDQLSKIATALGRSADAEAFDARAEALRPRIHKAWFDPKPNCYVNQKQTYLVMPLVAGVVPEKLRDTLNRKLEQSILVTSHGHLDTGMLGSYFLIQYLDSIGRDDLIWTIVTSPGYPGWRYLLDQGATTWGERWDGGPSRIHACFNLLDSWFYQGLAGIRPDPAAPGFKKIIIKPAIVGDLSWVSAQYDSLYGPIKSSWHRMGDQVTLNVTIPPNATATISVPTIDPSSVRETGENTLLPVESEAATYKVGSGVYEFTSRLSH